MIPVPDRRGRIIRYERTNEEWTAIQPMLPNKPRGMPRVNDRRVLNGIFPVLRSAAPWRDVIIELSLVGGPTVMTIASQPI